MSTSNHEQRTQTRGGWDRAELLSLLSASATLSGLCITVVALIKTIGVARGSPTIVDDIFGGCAAAFLLCTYFIFWAMRSRSRLLVAVLTKASDALFLLALSAMTVAAFLMLYSIW